MIVQQVVNPFEKNSSKAIVLLLFTFFVLSAIVTLYIKTKSIEVTQENY
jgi:hypothetical protein